VYNLAPAGKPAAAAERNSEQADEPAVVAEHNFARADKPAVVAERNSARADKPAAVAERNSEPAGKPAVAVERNSEQASNNLALEWSLTAAADNTRHIRADIHLSREANRDKSRLSYTWRARLILA
jgi:hypothetical protein